jgi:hypothetical protein
VELSSVISIAADEDTLLDVRTQWDEVVAGECTFDKATGVTTYALSELLTALNTFTVFVLRRRADSQSVIQGAWSFTTGSLGAVTVYCRFRGGKQRPVTHAIKLLRTGADLLSRLGPRFKLALGLRQGAFSSTQRRSPVRNRLLCSSPRMC